MKLIDRLNTLNPASWDYLVACTVIFFLGMCTAFTMMYLWLHPVD